MALRRFQSTHPVWGATREKFKGGNTHGNFNPRSPCGERLLQFSLQPGSQNFNPRSPCGERLVHTQIGMILIAFQSTLPVWGATVFPRILAVVLTHFNPRSPCGERQYDKAGNRSYEYFNPRSPCGERPQKKLRREFAEQFQSTLPVWGATLYIFITSINFCISIHAPRVGSDSFQHTPISPLTDFNPRSPCGERLQQSIKITRGSKFQSTLPVWGAT